MAAYNGNLYMQLSLTISRVDGTISIDSIDYAIGKGTSKSVVESEFARLNKSHIEHGNGYEWITLGGISFGGIPSCLSLCFFLDAVQQVQIGVSILDVECADNWATRASSEREVEAVCRELGKQLDCDFSSGQVTFSWGTVWSVFDERSCHPSSGLRYAG